VYYGNKVIVISYDVLKVATLQVILLHMTA